MLLQEVLLQMFKVGVANPQLNEGQAGMETRGPGWRCGNLGSSHCLAGNCPRAKPSASPDLWPTLERRKVYETDI